MLSAKGQSLRLAQEVHPVCHVLLPRQMLNFMLVRFVSESANLVVYLVVIFLIEMFLGIAVPETLFQVESNRSTEYFWAAPSLHVFKREILKPLVAN